MLKYEFTKREEDQGQKPRGRILCLKNKGRRVSRRSKFELLTIPFNLTSLSINVDNPGWNIYYYIL